ncbi:hypothetical protein H3L96_06840 [Neisseria wadsworthii]|nr:hypothetical protein H3L96_06840 [Neisseria wadsworthii]
MGACGFGRCLAGQPDLYQQAEKEELKFFNAVADCLAQCAATFGGGIDVYGRLALLDLLRWTNRAVKMQGGSEE